MATLLELANKFLTRQGLQTATQVATSTDATLIQVLGLLNEELEELTDVWNWQELTEEATFTSVATASQGALTTIAPTGFSRILNDTIFNRTLRTQIMGPMSARQWQLTQALSTGAPFEQYRIRGGALYVSPTMEAGHSCYFEYASTCAVLSSASVKKSAFTADDDTLRLSEKVVLAGLRWRWKREKGLDYEEEYNRWERMASTAAGRDGTKAILSMDGDCPTFEPAIYVPAGGTAL
jgi:hypothetical protein